MKKFFYVLVFSPIICFSQKINSGVQLGPIISFGEQGTAYGGQVIGNIQLDKRSSVGAGIQVIKFEELPEVYLPTFATMKITLPSKKLIYFFHFDAGYSVYNEEHFLENVHVKTMGGFYWGTGIGLHGNAAAAPYMELNYSFYKFHHDLSLNNSKLNISDHSDGIVISVGFWLHNKGNGRR